MGFMALVKTRKFWIQAVLVAILVGGGYFAVRDYIHTKQDLAVATKVNKQNKEEIEKFNKEMEETRKKLQQVNNNISTIKSGYYSAIRDLNVLKNRVDEFRDDPETGKVRVQESADGFMRDISCITGDSTQCEK